MAALDRVRLAKLLGMLGSEHDGEVVTAARMAHEMLHRHALGWDAVLTPPVPPMKIERIERVRPVRIEIVRQVEVPRPLPEHPLARLGFAARQFAGAVRHAGLPVAKLLLKVAAYPVVMLRDHATTVRQCFRQKLYLDLCLQAVIGACSVSLATALWGGLYYGLVTSLG